MQRIQLNKLGQEYLFHLEQQMKLANIYMPGDTDLSLYDAAYQYQLFNKYSLLAEQSTSIKDINSLSVVANRHYNNLLNILKSMGLTATTRAKLKVLENTNTNEGNILDTIETMLIEA